VDGVVELIGTEKEREREGNWMKGRGEKMKGRGEQDEYSARKGVMKCRQGDNSRLSMHNDKVGQG